MCDSCLWLHGWLSPSPSIQNILFILVRWFVYKSNKLISILLIKIRILTSHYKGVWYNERGRISMWPVCFQTSKIVVDQSQYLTHENEELKEEQGQGRQEFSVGSVQPQTDETKAMKKWKVWMLLPSPVLPAGLLISIFEQLQICNENIRSQFSLPKTTFISAQNCRMGRTPRVTSL